MLDRLSDNPQAGPLPMVSMIGPPAGRGSAPATTDAWTLLVVTHAPIAAAVVVLEPGHPDDVTYLLDGPLSQGGFCIVVSAEHAAVCRLPAADAACWACTAASLAGLPPLPGRLLPRLHVGAGALAAGPLNGPDRWHLEAHGAGPSTPHWRPLLMRVDCPHVAAAARVGEQLALLP